MSDTGSVSSIVVDSSGLSTFLCVLSVTEPFPISPEQENLTPSLVASIETMQTFQHELRVRVVESITYLIPITESNHDKSSETQQRAM